MINSSDLLEQLVRHKKELDKSNDHFQKLTSRKNELISEIKTSLDNSCETLDKVADLKGEIERETQKVERLKSEFETHEKNIIKLLNELEDKEFTVVLETKTDQGKTEHENYIVVLRSMLYQEQKRILEIRKS